MSEEMKNLPEVVRIRRDDLTITVDTAKYVNAKLKDLKEFGYNDLTKSDVESALLKVLNRQKLGVIGMFIEGDIVLDEEIEG